MRSQPPSARIQVRDLEVSLGQVEAKVHHGEIELGPAAGQDRLVLDEGVTPRVKSAEASVAPSELVDAVRAGLGEQGAAVADGLEVVLSDRDVFAVKGKMPTGEAYLLEGRVRHRGGRLLLAPTHGEARVEGLVARLNVPAGEATVRLTPKDVVERLSAVREASGRSHFVNPVVRPASDGQLQFSASVRDGERLIPLSAKVRPEVLQDGRLGLRLGDVRVEAAGHEARVDLTRGKASVEADWTELQRVIGGMLGPLVRETRVSADGTGGVKVVGTSTVGALVDLPNRRGVLGSKQVRVETSLGLAPARDGRLEVAIRRFEAKGDVLQMTLDGTAGQLRTRVTREGLLALLAEVLGPDLPVKGVSRVSDGTFRARLAPGGSELEVEGSLSVHEGNLQVRLDALSLPGGGGRATLSGKGSALAATLPWPELARGLERQLPLRGLRILPAEDGRVTVEGRLSVLGVPLLPVRMQLRPSLDASGRMGADLERVQVAGAGVLGALGAVGLDLERLAGKGLFAGNRLQLEALPLPRGVEIKGMSTGEAGLTLALQVDPKALGVGPTVTFEGSALTFAAKATLGLPGPVTGVRLEQDAVVLDAGVTRTGLVDILPPSPGMEVEGTRLVMPLGLGVGEAEATRLQGVSVGPAGATLTVDAKPLVAAAAEDLPRGMKLEGNLLRMELPRPGGLPLGARRVTVDAQGVQLVMGLPGKGLEESLPDLGPGVRWADGGLEVDLEAWAPGAKVREARVEDGALRLSLGEADLTPPRAMGAPVRVRTEGRMTVHGFVLEDAQVLVRPPADGPLQLDKVGPKDVSLQHGRVLVPPAKLDLLLREAMGEDHARMAPRLEGGRLVLQDGPVGLPVVMRVDAGKDGKLKLIPTSVLGNSPVLEVPQMLLGALLTPLTALFPEDARRSVDLAKVSGAGLPPLKGARITDEGLWLDFGNAWQNARSQGPA
ncbi:MAG: hypothetical protein VKO21_05970 [Candidatus Sericytochromatia bacterium]|nr:hypothetical protein [Candidatus Sericytochromatia bacterium]